MNEWMNGSSDWLAEWAGGPTGAAGAAAATGDCVIQRQLCIGMNANTSLLLVTQFLLWPWVVGNHSPSSHHHSFVLWSVVLVSAFTYLCTCTVPACSSCGDTETEEKLYKWTGKPEQQQKRRILLWSHWKFNYCALFEVIRNLIKIFNRIRKSSVPCCWWASCFSSPLPMVVVVVVGALDNTRWRRMSTIIELNVG